MSQDLDYTVKWQNAPRFVRDAILEELSELCRLLDANVVFEDWLVDRQLVAQKQAQQLELVQQRLLGLYQEQIQQEMVQMQKRLQHWLKQQSTKILDEVYTEQKTVAEKSGDA